MEYTIDLRKECAALQLAGNSINKTWPSLPLDIFCSEAYVDPKKLKVGNIVLCMVGPLDGFLKAKVTHLYKKWVFMEMMEGAYLGEEHVFSSRSQFYKEFILPAKILVSKGWKDRIRLPAKEILIVEE